MSAATELLQVPEAARRLGLKTSTLRAWILAQKITYVRVGSRAIRIPVSEVEKVISAGFVPARSEEAGR